MINRELLNPRSIVIVGASNDIRKPGGKILKNIIDHGYRGQLYVIHPKASEVQGVKSYSDTDSLPQTDLAILAIPASMCPEIVKELATTKQTRAFIIISAGFSEENAAGASLEHEIVAILNETGSCLIGPNCIGVITTSYAGCFTLPIPKLDPKGVDFISGSGATAVYVMESAIPNGLTFSTVFSVGNSAQLGVEDILEYLDESFDPETSSRVKLLYLESIRKPDKLLRHASSLIRKGCRIAAIKSGSSEAGSRAASSHTGALASPDTAVDALFKKAGIVRCYSRSELTTVGALFMHNKLEGNRLAIITHAGGPAVMLTDVLSDGGLEVPLISGKPAEQLLIRLHPGSSVANPIDVLATGGVEQLDAAIECVDKELDNIDGMCIIFGSPGLFSVEPVYKLIDEKMKTCRKPIYPILPSTVNASEEIGFFLARGRINFPDEVLFGQALVKSRQAPEPSLASSNLQTSAHQKIRKLIDQFSDGYLAPDQVQKLLDAAGITRIPERVVNTFEEAVSSALSLGFPVVMKVVGPVHKTEVGGVLLNLANHEDVVNALNRLMSIDGSTGVLLQPMLKGRELFVGAKRETPFGHLIMIGLGGIFIEILKDVQAGLAPLSRSDISLMINNLKSKKLLDGVRGQQYIAIEKWIDLIIGVSDLVVSAPEIAEMDLNPVMGLTDKVVAVDARIRIEK
ncbi:MAG: CoA-binding protein [Porphyromonadaceae bacterium]|nr:MAG: CoA-binding protein [Porphyromonadaceae bacterium]